MEILFYQIDASRPGDSTVTVIVAGTATDGSDRVATLVIESTTSLDDENIADFLSTWRAGNGSAIQAAIDAGQLATNDQRGLIATGGALAWYRDHPNAALLFELPIDDLDAAIQNRTAAGETLLLKTLAIAVRVLARREGLI